MGKVFFLHHACVTKSKENVCLGASTKSTKVLLGRRNTCKNMICMCIETSVHVRQQHANAGGDNESLWQKVLAVLSVEIYDNM